MKKIKRLFKTFFPQFDDVDTTSDVPSLAGTDTESCSFSDDEGYDSVEQEVLSKEDEDVAMFNKLALQLSLKSLLFLLQNHARAMHIPEAELIRSIEYTRSLSKQKLPPTRKIKKCRFADICGGKQVRTVVHVIPPVAEEDREQLWWTEKEEQVIRKHCAKTIRFYKSKRPYYAESVQVLADSYSEESDDILVEHHLKKLADDSYARGLETHFVRSLRDLRKGVVRAVLEEQDQCRNEPYDTVCKRLCACSCALSSPNKALAAKLAECDQVNGLKASLSKWETSRNVPS